MGKLKRSHPVIQFIKENLSEYEFEEKNNKLFLKRARANEQQIDTMGQIVVCLSSLKADSWVDVEILHVKSGKAKEILKIAVGLAKEIDNKLVETLEIRSITERISDHLSGLNISLGNISLGSVQKERAHGEKEEVDKVVLKIGILTRLVLRSTINEGFS